MQPLEETIRQQLLPALTGRDSPSDVERKLLALPVCHWGPGIGEPNSHGGGAHLLTASHRTTDCTY